MKNFVIIILLVVFSLTVYPQKNAKKTPAPSPVAEKTPLDEAQEFQNARAQTSLTDRIAALKKFTEDFPESEQKTFALELIASSRAELGDQKLRLSDNQSGIELFKLAAAEAPTPVSNNFFNEILAQIPTNLFFRGQREAAFDAAMIIEEKIAGNSQQLLALAAFYLGTEAAAEAKRVAEKVLEIEPASVAAYQTLGLANRMNFDLEESAAAYAKALEINPDSIISMRSLAEMKRATGKADEAAALYRTMLEKDAADNSAQTGLILSLFNADRRAEAETEMERALDANPNNLFLLVGAAYWYAAHNQGAKAIELAEKAIAVEPRYTWAHIALARGLIKQKRPLEAERTLLIARQHGNFPTLNYEIAAARMAAGFYREAANELEKTFSVKDGLVSANLGGRVLKEGKSFIEILSFERRASIFEPVAADDPVMAEKLKSLLKFSRKLDAAEPNETEIAEAAEEFFKGEDNMKLHRGLFIANRLLDKRIAPAKVLEMAQAAIGKVETGLDITSPAAAVMADELYETRMIAATRNELLIVPDVPRPTLSRILRGRIEELTGRAFLEQGKTDEAAVRFRRAISILPEKSVWWHSSKWRLGSALEAVGKSKEALDAYIEGYNTEAPDPAKRIIIESLYEKVNGTVEGLDQIIGAKPQITGQETAQIVKPAETSTPEPTPEITPQPTPVNIKIPANVPIAIEEPKTDNYLQTDVKPTSTPENLIIPENVPMVKTDPTPEKTEETPENTDVTTEENADISPVSPDPVKTETTPTPETTPEVEPTPEEIKTDETLPVTEETPAPTPEIPAETLPETAETSEKNTEPEKTENITEPAENLTAEKPPNSLFDPIIISVPKIEKKAKTDEKPENPEEKSEDKSARTDADETAASAPPEKTPETVTTSRPRIVSGAKTENNPENTTAPCTLIISEDKISIVRDGGKLGVFASFEGTGGDFSELTAIPGNSQDISVEFQKDVGVLAERALFVITSISPKTGIFTVIFESNCGKKEVTVTVR